MQHGVQQRASVTIRQNKPIAINLKNSIAIDYSFKNKGKKGMMTITQLGLLGEKRMYFENNKYAIGAMPVNLNITKNKLLI